MLSTVVLRNQGKNLTSTQSKNSYVCGKTLIGTNIALDQWNILYDFQPKQPNNLVGSSWGKLGCVCVWFLFLTMPFPTAAFYECEMHQRGMLLFRHVALVLLQGLLSASLDCEESIQGVNDVLAACRTKCPLLLCSAGVSDLC